MARPRITPTDEPEAEIDEVEVEPAPSLPLHDGTAIAWPVDEQAWRIHAALAGRSLWSWWDYPERREVVCVTYPDGMKIRIPYATTQ